MLTKESLIRALENSRHISGEKLQKAIEMHKTMGGKLSSILVSEGLLNEQDLAVLISQELGIPVLNLSSLKIDPEVIKIIPKKIAERYELVAIAKMGKVLTIAMSDPLNIFALDDVKQITGCTILPIVTTSKDILNALESYLEGTTQIDDLIVGINETDVEVIREEDNGKIKEAGSEDQAPVIRMMDLIIREALKRRASDIHIEPYESDLRVRYRIDGALQDGFHPPPNMQGSLMSRLKIMADLNITERRVPQDGRFRVKTEGREIDFRVSVLPMQFGEKAVLRVLDRSSVQVGLDNLGYSPETLSRFKDAVKKPYGMILVTGPTGSGKSTTLYSVLNTLNTPDRNIMTIEDPVEYQVEGISQTQAMTEIGLTFASGLRSILRQSPDVILVGEIRDTETADIAVKAALTGHLVLSTLHTNSASGAFTRLVDMGIEPFLIASSVVLVTAQRLCRKICVKCKEPYQVPNETLERLKIDSAVIKKISAFHGKGCKFCNETGYRGRMGVMEALWVDEVIRSLILERSSSDEVQEAARKAGMRTLFENAFANFEAGHTTLEEVLRITTEG
ncbi:MAG: Flp pilus assembly complex ATPase component TadA [Candidatus Omnitrophica bacterium]|nr:Flp pilus assembly complex ATPase component TadA [Candidatus Omnitrophota bacterium]